MKKKRTIGFQFTYFGDYPTNMQFYINDNEKMITETVSTYYVISEKDTIKLFGIYRDWFDGALISFKDSNKKYTYIMILSYDRETIIQNENGYIKWNKPTIEYVLYMNNVFKNYQDIDCINFRFMANE